MRRARSRRRRKNLRRLARLHRPLPEPDPLVWGEAGAALPDPESARDAWQLDSTLQRLLRQRNRLDWERGRLLLFMEKRALYRHLDFPSFHHYLDYALGLSPRDARQAVSLQNDLAFLPALSRAVEQGLLAPRKAARLCWVAEPHTDALWLDYSRRCCWKRVDLSIDKHLAYRGMVGWHEWRRKTGGLPPEGVRMRRLHQDWREMFGTRERARRARREAARGARARRDAAARRGGVCGCAKKAGEGVCDSGKGAEGGVCDCGKSGEGGACDRDIDLELAAEDAEAGLPDPLPSPFGRLGSVSCRGPASVARRLRSAIRATRSRFGHRLDDGQCIHRMLLHFAKVHMHPEMEERLSRYLIAEDAGWVCSSPHCRSFGPFHRHHRLYRSRGGGDEPANLVLLCDACHRLVHDGKMVIRGRAPDDLVYLFGLRPDGSAREAYRDGVRAPELEVPDGSGP
jgi:5-methylcytosine-specific restriction endonuclease McrA